MSRFTTALITSVIFSASAFGQTVKQGDSRQDPTVFHSPMVLETVFAASDRSLWEKTDNKYGGRYWFTVPEYHELGKYTCDGISLTDPTDRSKRTYEGQWDNSLFMSVRTLSDGNVDLGIRVKVTNPKNNHDKLVDLFFEIMKGDDVSASALMKQLRIEEKSYGDDGKLTMVLPASTVLSATKLRITMTTRDY
jgi:hypothetical protein